MVGEIPDQRFTAVVISSSKLQIMTCELSKIRNRAKRIRVFTNEMMILSGSNLGLGRIINRVPPGMVWRYNLFLD